MVTTRGVGRPVLKTGQGCIRDIPCRDANVNLGAVLSNHECVLGLLDNIFLFARLYLCQHM